jgi:hypothetical protein
MRIAGRNSTTPQSRQNATSTKPSIFQDAWGKVTKHFSENWVSMLFNAAKFFLTQVLFFGIGWVIYNIWELKQNYATLEERSKNAQSSLICKNPPRCLHLQKLQKEFHANLRGGVFGVFVEIFQ